MIEPTITRAQLLAWHPCGRAPGEQYDDTSLDVLFAGREQLTVADTARLDIPRRDVVWVWTQPGALPAVVRQRWIERVADRSVRRHAPHSGVLAVEQWAAAWLAGDRAEARADEAAAAAWASASAAAREAAWEARAAAGARAGAAAREAEYQQQVHGLLDVLQETS